MKRELIIQLTRFGDLIQTKRLVKSLLSEGSEVHLMIDRSLSPLAVLVYPEVILHPIIAHGTGLSNKDYWRVMNDNQNVFSAVISVGFDRIYNLNYSPMNFAISAMFPEEKVVGYHYHHGQHLRSKWIELAFRFSANRRCGINLVDFWGAFAKKMIKPENVNPDASPKGGGIGIVLAGRNSRRSIPIKSLSPILNAIRSRAENKKIYLLGSASEQKAGYELISCLPSHVAADTSNLAGKTNWKDLYNIVASLDRIFTPDTGTMHLAAHLGTPVSAFFLSSAWCGETGPYGRGHTIVQSSVHCAPCLESAPCPRNIMCGDSFSSNEIVRFCATGKSSHLPENVFLFKSDLDSLGACLKLLHGDDKFESERNNMRDFLACHLGLDDLGELGPFNNLAVKYYHERDWITSSIKS